MRKFRVTQKVNPSLLPYAMLWNNRFIGAKICSSLIIHVPGKRTSGSVNTRANAWSHVTPHDKQKAVILWPRNNLDDPYLEVASKVSQAVQRKCSTHQVLFRTLTTIIIIRTGRDCSNVYYVPVHTAYHLLCKVCCS